MAKRIKILFTIPNFDTAGSGKVVYDLVKGLDSTQFAPEICCFHNRGAYFEVVKRLGVPIHLFEFAVPYRPFISLPWRILKLSRFFKRYQFDVIHSWHWSSDFTEPLAAKLAGIPYIYTKKAMSWGNKSWKWRSQLSTKIIAINSDMISEFFSDLRSKTLYMPLGVDTAYYSPLAYTRVLPEGLRFKPTDFVILSVANLVPVKGIEVLLDALHLIDDERLKVLVVGSHQSDYAQELISHYASEQVRFVGKQLDVRPYLAVADVFVIPTKDEGRKEGLPIAPLEAMASSRLVVGSDIPGIRDLLSRFSDFLFEAGNSKALAEVIKTLMHMPEHKLQFYKDAMQQEASMRFSLERCIKAHEALYMELYTNT